ncbi:Histone-lysine N-methyltransferase ATXR6, putative [Ricinus communis]|uniref:[histone H3]-lysine(27) N-methyltransferase n=2 Tax=Ricinus communis TaxID=3988 RepID=B9RZJ4_RICCO|nr:Histone-lysine N-methyltransferase ATXR6, putative [Ricinus communis]
MALRRRTQAPNPFLSPSPYAHNLEDDDDYVWCQECGSGQSPAELLLCDKCDRGYHLFCLRPILVSVPKGSWFCPSCSLQKKPKSFPLVQTKIIDFFRIQRSTQSTQNLGQESLKKRKRSSSLVLSKKRRKLLPFNPSDDPERRLEQMRSLATALTASGTKFSNELTYQPGMAPKSANCPALEREGMQVLPKEDIETLNLCKSMMDRGECPPLMVVFDPHEGFTVEADRSIKDLTIITEYVGDVDYLMNRESDDGDSMMTLLCTANPSKSLVICPDKRGNIARFINGINNHSLDGKKKQNLKCVRFNVNGECRVLLIANRDIKKGERLYYDYNGYEHEYPTEHFV